MSVLNITKKSNKNTSKKYYGLKQYIHTDQETPNFIT